MVDMDTIMHFMGRLTGREATLSRVYIPHIDLLDEDGVQC